MKVTITIPEDLTKWIDQRVDLREFATRSHAIEVAVTQLKRNKTELVIKK